MDVRFAESAVVEEVVGVEILLDEIEEIEPVFGREIFDFCILQTPLVKLTTYVSGAMFRAGTIGLGFSEPWALASHSSFDNSVFAINIFVDLDVGIAKAVEKLL